MANRLVTSFVVKIEDNASEYWSDKDIRDALLRAFPSGVRDGLKIEVRDLEAKKLHSWWK